VGHASTSNRVDQTSSGGAAIVTWYSNSMRASWSTAAAHGNAGPDATGQGRTLPHKVEAVPDRADTPGVSVDAAPPPDADRLHRVSGEFVDPGTETAFRQDALAVHLRLYGQVALLIGAGFAAFALIDWASLGTSATFAWLLAARLGAAALVLTTRRRLLRHPEQFSAAAGLDLIAVTQLVVYAVVLLACALRPADAATNAVSVAVLVLGAMVLVPGRFAVQVWIGIAGAAGFVAVSVLRYDDPALALLPLSANLAVAVTWGATILRLTNRDTRRRWSAVRAGDRANERLEQELAAADLLRAELQTLARQDPLTSAANRRELLRAAEVLLGDRRRSGTVSLLLMDADRFKSINDRFGHAVGDESLVALVDAARAAVRSEDLVARVGGEEFAVLLPDMTEAAAAATAERVRHAVQAAAPQGHDGLELTVSVGVATAREGDTVERLLARADEAMYRVKRAGGNAVGAAPPEPERATAAH
jgi:diguanylate cyclase (GGDEF)-like protein